MDGFRLKRSQFSCPTCPGQEDEGAFLFFVPAAEIRQDGNGSYEATCPQCGNEHCAELWYMATLRAKCFGAKTPEGKLKVSMNSYRTGSSYRTGAIPRYVPPAKPGKYDECESCQDIEECRQAVEDASGTARYVACHRIGEVIAKYRNAHLSGDPAALRFTAAENQAKMQRVMNQCFKSIFDNGIFLNKGIYHEGKRVDEEQVINPAINESIKILEKMGFSLVDWTLTPKSKEAKAALEGYLAGQAAAQGSTMDDFMKKHNDDMKKFHDALTRGNVRVTQDATLKEADEEKDPGE
jgi:hypothetical protein